MTFTKEQVEWIVAEVLRRLGVAGGEQSLTPAAEASDLAITDRLVTLQSIDGRLAGVKRIAVQSCAVITPAVKDELKRRKIELVRESRT